VDGALLEEFTDLAFAAAAEVRWCEAQLGEADNLGMGAVIADDLQGELLEHLMTNFEHVNHSLLSWCQDKSAKTCAKILGKIGGTATIKMSVGSLQRIQNTRIKNKFAASPVATRNW